MNSENDITYKIGQRYLFNVKTHQLTDKEDNSITDLGLNESRLLAVLISSNGEVVTREQILEEVWNQRGLVVDETSVNQTVSLLRKFLGDNVKDQKIIKTVTKMGYKLTAGIKVESVDVERESSSFFKSVNQIPIIFGLYAALFSLLVSLSVYGGIKQGEGFNKQLTDYNKVVIDGIEILKYKNNKIDNELSTLIEKCILINVDENLAEITSVIVSAKKKYSFTILFMLDNGVDFSLAVKINKGIPLGENLCQVI